MKKLLFVFGTRPEAIKMIPVILKVRNSGYFETKICVTGQHRQMLDQVLNLFQIKADFDLNIMRPNQTLNEICKAVIGGVDEVLANEHFDCVLVHGDTTTTMSASLAAFHRRVRLGHIEAGLRTYNMNSPWPEEMNRRVAGLLADFHFAPTETSQRNLLSEKVDSHKIFVTGNTVIDALHLVVGKLEEPQSSLTAELTQKFGFLDPQKKLILVTGHRRENFGSQFEDICHGLKKIAQHHDVQVVYPVHLNPQVQAPVQKILGNLPNVFLLEPQEYLPFVFLMSRSYLIITDSGGVQEEAPSLDKPVLVMRDTTERPEAVQAGTVRLVGPSGEQIYTNTKMLLENPREYQKMKLSQNPYGDGRASERIIEVLRQAL